MGTRALGLTRCRWLDHGCCGSLDVEAGRAMPSRVTAGVVADPICLEQYDAEYLGVLAMQHLELFDLTPPFYYYAPHRIVNRDHARVYPLYDALRRRFGCDMNLDLNRLARSTSAGSLQGLSGRDARDIPAAVPAYIVDGDLASAAKARTLKLVSPLLNGVQRAPALTLL